MNFPPPPSNPAELAEIRAQQSTDQSFDMTKADLQLLAELDHGAEQLGFLGQSYFVEANRALVVPASFEATELATYRSYFGLAFEGTFATYGKVHIGQLIGTGAIRAICLAFPRATLLPYFDDLDPQDILYVPALAVASIERT
jgi:hypothetical protein